jgi:metallophosphoesterase (TIGR03768 family)
MPINAPEKTTDSVDSVTITRREFMCYSAGFFGTLALSPDAFGEIEGDKTPVKIVQYPINPKVATTLQEMISFPRTIPGLAKTEIFKIEQFDKFGYGKWAPGSCLPLATRTDIMAKDFSKPSSSRIIKISNFFTFSDIHITDKEAPNQLIYFQQAERFVYNNTSVYSPVMLYTTHVLDAAIQTVNALHKQIPFDFGISLGDTCNSTSYNELRWYIDVIDGKVIRPSSGAHLGEDTIDYQKPYQAAGLDKSIPWYQTLGNHDHFFLGCFPVDANPALGLRASYPADTVWAIADILVPNQQTFPVLFNINGITAEPKFYPGVLDGSTPYGTIIHAGPSTDPAFAAGAPKITADPGRRSLVRTEWVQEFGSSTNQVDLSKFCIGAASR